MIRGACVDPLPAAGVSTNPLTFHGGDLEAARERFPTAPSPWLDLSTGINQVPYPVDRLNDATWTQLPIPADIAALEATAARRYGAHASIRVVAAPGTQAIIQALPLLMPGFSVAVLGPTYAGHIRAWEAVGTRVLVAQDLDALRHSDIAIVVNPNNPDGRLVQRSDLLALAADLGSRGAMLVVDEAFADVLSTSASLVPVLPESGAIVLRSFGKAYGLAGLRLGFAICGSGHETMMRRAFGSWAVSGPAVAIGRAALADHEWIFAATQRLARDAQALDDLLSDEGFTIVGGTPLYRLVASDAATSAFECLARAGILVRPFDYDPSWLRFGVPHRVMDRIRIRDALRCHADNDSQVTS